MKKLLFLCFTILLFSSCTDDDIEDLNIYTHPLPVISVTVPEEFRYNEAYDIHYTFEKPTTCHFYDYIFSVRDGDHINIAVMGYVLDEGTACQEVVEEEERFFKFICTKNTGSYIFNFWAGKDENGDDVYLTYEVPVN